MLQEAEISTLSEADCSKFGKKMKVDTEVEICGGRKIPKRPPKVFSRKSSTEFKEVASEVKETNNKDFYLGQ